MQNSILQRHYIITYNIKHSIRINLKIMMSNNISNSHYSLPFN